MAIPFWKVIANMLLEEARLGCAPDLSEAAFFNRNGCPESDVCKFLAGGFGAEMQTRCMKGFPSDVRL